MAELLQLLGIGAEFAPHITWMGVITIGGTSIYAYVRITKRFKAWLEDLIAKTPRSKQAQNGLRELAETTSEVVHEIAAETRKQGERIATLEGYVLGRRSAKEEQNAEHLNGNAVE